MVKISVYFRIQKKGNLKFDKIVPSLETKVSIPKDLENMLKSGADVIKFEESNGTNTIYEKVENISFMGYCEFMDDALHTPTGKKAPYNVITYESK